MGVNGASGLMDLENMAAIDRWRAALRDHRDELKLAFSGHALGCWTQQLQHHPTTRTPQEGAAGNCGAARRTWLLLAIAIKKGPTTRSSSSASFVSTLLLIALPLLAYSRLSLCSRTAPHRRQSLKRGSVTQ